MVALFFFMCGIDTAAIESPSFLDYSPEYFTHDSSRRVHENKLYIYRFNPSKINEFIYSFSECNNAIKEAMEKSGLETPIIKRIDFCFDDDTNEYRDLYKLNHLLFFLIAKKLKIKNDYSSCGIQSPVLKTLRIQNRRFQAEFYNKAVEEPNGRIKCRLELRNMCVNCPADDKKAIADALRQWLNILVSVTQLKKGDLDILLNDLNDEIMNRYSEDVKRGDYGKKDFRSMIQRYHRYIFTRRQLSELLRRMDYKSYDSIASKYKNAHRGMEFFKICELRKYVNHIIDAANSFLNL